MGGKNRTILINLEKIGETFAVAALTSNNFVGLI